MSKPKVDWKAVWKGFEKWWEKHGGASWEAQVKTIQRLVNKHML